MIVKTLFALMTLALGGCASNLAADPAKMTPAQLQAWAKDRNASLACTTYKNVAAEGVVLYLVIDRGILVNGSLSIDSTCRVTLRNEPAPLRPLDASSAPAR